MVSTLSYRAAQTTNTRDMHVGNPGVPCLCWVTIITTVTVVRFALLGATLVAILNLHAYLGARICFICTLGTPRRRSPRPARPCTTFPQQRSPEHRKPMQATIPRVGRDCPFKTPRPTYLHPQHTSLPPRPISGPLSAVRPRPTRTPNARRRRLFARCNARPRQLARFENRGAMPPISARGNCHNRTQHQVATGILRPSFCSAYSRCIIIGPRPCITFRQQPPFMVV